MKIQKIKTRNVLFTITTSAGWDLNLHLIMGDKYNYIVDTGLGFGSMEPILKYIQEHNSGKPLMIINTHFHWDHIWGNSLFKDHFIIAHKLCPHEIEKHWDEMLKKNHVHMDGQVEKHLPNLLFDEALYFAEDRIRLIHTPGHSADSISVLDELDRVLNAGDNIGDTLDDLIPALDGDPAIYVQSLHKYQTLDFDTCLSGHNVVLGKEVIERILNLVESDKTLEHLDKALEPLEKVSVDLVDLPYDDVSLIKDLWEKNRLYHEKTSEHFGYLYHNLCFEDRITGFSKFKEEDLKITVAKTNDKVIGYCISTAVDGHGELASLHVAVEFRGKGIGQHLSEAHLEWMKKKNCKMTSVTVSQENKATIAFYTRLGFLPNTLEMLRE